jgi:hypothetical protein
MQCDLAFINKLKGLKIANEYDELIEVPVLYITPEKEAKIETLPAIAIYRAGVFQNDVRWTNDKFYDNYQFNVDGDPIKVDERDAPDPFDIYYGIRVLYEYHEDGIILNNHIMKSFRRGSYLTIGTHNYDILYVSYRNPDNTYRDFGEIKQNEKRKFVEQYVFKVEIELDNAVRTTLNTSLETIITTHTTQNQ